MDREPRDFARRGPRRAASLTAAVHWPDGSTALAVVTNVSYTGCRLVSEKRFTRGETVRLFLPGRGQVHAQVRWVRAGAAGTHFLTGDSSKDARRARIGV